MADFSILFVCMGNICRSPAAEGVMKHKIAEAGLESRVFVDSAGTISFHKGSPADSRMRLSAQKRGIELTSLARQIKPEDLNRFDLIITMDLDNFEDVRRLKGANKCLDKIKPFTDYCMAHADKEVPDPYYGGDAGFEHVLDLLDDGCSVLLEEIKKSLGEA